MLRGLMILRWEKRDQQLAYCVGILVSAMHDATNHQPDRCCHLNHRKSRGSLKNWKLLV